MADAFSTADTKSLLRGKHILYIGDSNIRAQYKDLVWLLNSNTLINKANLRAKLELSYLGDRLVARSQLHHGRDYQEERQYIDEYDEIKVEFMFISRCYNKNIEDLLTSFKEKTKPIPNVIVINSCVWDINRWGPNGVPEYKDNMVKLMRLMKKCLPKECLVVWTTALPPAAHVKGGFIIKQIEFMQPMLRFEVMEANTFARETVISYGFDVLDNHYYTRMQMHRRAKDGIHYLSIPVRFMTNLLLTHLSLSWDRDLPGNITSVLLDKAISVDSKPVKGSPINLPTSGIFSKINLTSPVVPRTRGLQITINTQEGDTQNVRRCDMLQDEVLEQPSYQNDNIENYTWGTSDYIPQLTPGVDHERLHSYWELPPIDAHEAGPCRPKKKKSKKKKRNDPYHDQYNYRYNYRH